MPRQLYQDNKLPVALPPPPPELEEEEASESAPVFVKCKRSEKCSKENGHVGGCNSKLAKKPKNAAKAPKAPKAAKKAAATPAAAPPAKRTKKAPAPPVEVERFSPEIEEALRILCAAEKDLKEEVVPVNHLKSVVDKKLNEIWGEDGMPIEDEDAMNKLPSLCAKIKKEAIEAYHAAHPSPLRTAYLAALEMVKKLKSIQDPAEIAFTTEEASSSNAH